MTSADGRRALTELFGGRGWPAQGDDLLRRSLGPRGPELLLEAPGWLGLEAGRLVLEAECRDATHAIALAGRYGCRVLGVDLVGVWLPRGRVEAAIEAAGFRALRRERIASEWSEHQLERDPGHLTDDLLEIARLIRNREEAETVLGPVWYRRALAFAAWRLQIVQGRLLPVLYALANDRHRPARDPGQ
jgi:hypothetical protein